MAKAHKNYRCLNHCVVIAKNARIILPQKVEEVYAWEPFIRDVARREELHNMRISIKTPPIHNGMLFVSLTSFPQEFSFDRFLAVIVDLQEILGDIHDCDVVLEVFNRLYASIRAGVLQAPGIA